MRNQTRKQALASLSRRTSSPYPVNPRQLKAEHIHAAPDAFSFRPPATKDHTQRAMIAELREAIRKTKKPLSPVLVVWTSHAWTVADGFLRLAAYKAAGWERAIPVEVFAGTPDEALQEAQNRNRKASIQLTTSQRMDVAWFYVVAYELSRKRTAELTGTSTRQVSNMRKARQQLEAKGIDPAQLPAWKDALRQTLPHGDAPDFDEDAAMEVERERIGRAWGKPQHHKTQLQARALVAHFGGLADQLADAMLEELGRTSEEAQAEEDEDEAEADF